MGHAFKHSLGLCRSPRIGSAPAVVCPGQDSGVAGFGDAERRLGNARHERAHSGFPCIGICKAKDQHCVEKPGHAAWQRRPARHHLAAPPTCGAWSEPRSGTMRTWRRSISASVAAILGLSLSVSGCVTTTADVVQPPETVRAQMPSPPSVTVPTVPTPTAPISAVPTVVPISPVPTPTGPSLPGLTNPMTPTAPTVIPTPAPIPPYRTTHTYVPADGMPNNTTIVKTPFPPAPGHATLNGPRTTPGGAHSAYGGTTDGPADFDPLMAH